MTFAQKEVKEAKSKLHKRLNYQDKRNSEDDEMKIQGTNTAVSWDQCLNKINEQKKKFGTKMNMEDFERVQQYFHTLHMAGGDYSTVDELLLELDKPKVESRGVLDLVVENLPVMLIKMPKTRYLMAVDKFLMCPNLVSALYMQNCAQQSERGTEEPCPGQL